jgi:hypothetical protein
MCDRCGTVFSEREENWSTFSGSTRKKDAEGKWVTVSDTLDACPDCNSIMTTPQRPAAMPTDAARALPGEHTVSPHYEPGM